MAETLLTLRDIVVRHGPSTVLEITSLEIFSGEILAVIGPNGAGKSTLLRVIGLLHSPSAGKIYFEGKEAERRNALHLRRQMASVFQQPLLMNATLFDNAALGLRLRRMAAADIEKRLRPWLERLGISHLASRPARTLSGGEAQRTSLARALSLNPKLLLLDEPFSALDPPTREALILDLQKIFAATGITAVLVTHDRYEALMLGQRIGVLSSGRLLQLGTNLDVFARPANERVAEIVGIDNRIAGIVRSSDGGTSAVDFNGGAIKVLGRWQPQSKVILCIRPENVVVSQPSQWEEPASEKNQFPAKVATLSPWMSNYRLVLECGGVHLVTVIDSATFRRLAPAPGDIVMACIDPAAIHVLEP